jgi:chromosome segregation ATPase
MPRRRAAPTPAEVTKEDFDSLRQKFQLLEGDRKAYFETYEQTKKQNDATVREIRAENAELRKAISELKREHRGSRSAKDDQQELSQETSRVNRLRSEFDALRHKTNQLSLKLEESKDSLGDLELESRRPAQEDSPLTRKIRMLENRLDKAMIKYNEAQSIRKTYEQIVKRLGEERVGFDNQLAAIERTLRAKQHDYEELQLLSGDAKHAKEIAMQELDRVKRRYQEQVSLRSSDLKDREALVKQREAINQRISDREQKRQDLIAQASGDLGKEEEDNLKKALTINKMQEGRIESEASAVKEKLDVYERAFRRIKDATGVSDVNEVIQKIVSQEDTQQNLMELTKENQARIEALQEDKARVKAAVEELKYAGPGGRGGARKAVDDLEEKTSKSQTRLERSRQKFERLQRVLIDGQAGIEHLAAKLAHVDLGEGKTLRPQQMSDESIVNILFGCETALVEMLSRLKAEQAKYGAGYGGAAAAAAAAEEGFDEEELQANRPYNRRITLPREGGEGFGGDGEMGGDAGGGLGPDEEVSREQMKSDAQALVNARTNKKGPKKKKKKRSEQEALRRGGARGRGGKKHGVV